MDKPIAFYIIQAIFDLIVLGIMIAAGVEDAKTRKVEPKYQLSLLVVAVLHTIFRFIPALGGGLWDGLNCIFTGLGVFALYLVLVLVFKTGIGGADTKMTSILGLYLGVEPAIILMIAHCLSGLLYAGYERVVHNKHIASVPLMVFLSIGFVIARVFEWITYFIA